MEQRGRWRWNGKTTVLGIFMDEKGILRSIIMIIMMARGFGGFGACQMGVYSETGRPTPGGPVRPPGRVR